MLGDLALLDAYSRAVVDAVQGLTIADLDYLHDSKANTIGALLRHLVGTKRLYQIHTFEAKRWNEWDEETRKQWDVPASLGPEARRTIKGNELHHYLEDGSVLTIGNNTLQANYEGRALRKREADGDVREHQVLPLSAARLPGWLRARPRSRRLTAPSIGLGYCGNRTRTAPG